LGEEPGGAAIPFPFYPKGTPLAAIIAPWSSFLKSAEYLLLTTIGSGIQ
jgi:hypothetical protein